MMTAAVISGIRSTSRFFRKSDTFFTDKTSLYMDYTAEKHPMSGKPNLCIRMRSRTLMEESSSHFCCRFILSGMKNPMLSGKCGILMPFSVLF